MRPAGLLALIQDLYAARKNNQTFLHTRFGLGEDNLKPDKKTFQRRTDRQIPPEVDPLTGANPRQRRSTRRCARSPL
jgi:hypothetical protein